MKTKKSNRANLENFRTIFLQIGLILALSAILVAFEWKSNVNYLIDYKDNNVGIDIEEFPPVTRPEQEKKKIVKPLVPIEKFIIENDDVIIEDEPNFIDTEDNWDIPIPEFDEPEENVDNEPIIFAEFMPTFQGKDGSYFRNYIAENIIFPNDAKEFGISGTVYIAFVIDKDGSISNVEIIRGVHPIVDQAVLEVIKSSPKWEPGINNGRYVRVKYTIAIAFKLL